MSSAGVGALLFLCSAANSALQNRKNGFKKKGKMFKIMACRKVGRIRVRHCRWRRWYHQPRFRRKRRLKRLRRAFAKRHLRKVGSDPCVIAGQVPIGNFSVNAKGIQQVHHNYEGFDLRGGGKGKGHVEAASQSDLLFKAITEVLVKFRVDRSDGQQGPRSKDKHQKTFFEALQQSLDRYSRKPHDKLIQSITSIVEAAKAGKLSMDKPNPRADDVPDKGGGKGAGQTTGKEDKHEDKSKSKGKGKAKRDITESKTDEGDTWTQVVRRKPKPKLTLHHAAWGPDKIIEDEVLRKTLEQGQCPTGAASLCRSTDFAKQCRDLAALRGINCKVAILTQEDPGGATQMTFTVCSSSAPSLQKLYVQPLVKDLPVMPKSPVSKSTHKPTEIQLQVFRITVPAIFADKSKWQHINASPQRALQSLVEAPEIHSTYGWKQSTIGSGDRRTTLLEGFAKLTTHGASQLQNNNGKDGIFGRPLAQQQSEFCKQPVQWLDKNTDDNYLTYILKCKNQAYSAKLPLAFRTGGGACLGLRYTGDSKPPATAVAWRVQGSPSWFRDAELQEALSGAGWTDVHIILPPQGRKPWMIKAKAPNDSEGTVLGVEVGDHTLCLTRVPPRAPQVVGVTPVRPTRQLRSKQSSMPFTTSQEMEVEEKQSENDVNMDQSRQHDGAEDTKKREPPVKNSPPRKKSKDVPSLFGYSLKDCGAEGACGYNSLAFAFWLSNDNLDKAHPSDDEIKTMGRTLRQQVHQHICKHQGKYSKDWVADPRWSVETEGGEVPSTFDGWLLSLLRPQRWICQTTLQAAANRLGVNITVLVNNGGDKRAVLIPCQQTFANTVVLYLKDKHYQAVIPTKKAWPLEWTTLAEKLGDIPRGGRCHCVVDAFIHAAGAKYANGRDGREREEAQTCRHKDIPLEDRATLIDRTAIVEASCDIPEEDRDWECPFCHKWLPKFANYHQKQKNVRHHYDTMHPRRDTSNGAIQKARQRIFKKDRSKCPNYVEGYKKVSAKNKANRKRNLQLGGHTMVPFQPVWAEWPRTTKRSSTTRKGLLFTCTTCRTIGNYNKHNWKKCLGPSSLPTPRARLRWKEIRKSTANTNVLLKCWGTTKAEADSHFSRLVQEGVEPQPGPQPQTMVADDSEDGGEDDDDPDPGGGGKSTAPRSSATLTSVNVRDAPGLWRLLKLLEGEPNIADIVCVQEPCVQLLESKTVLSKFQSLGYTAYFVEGETGKKATGGCITAIRASIPHKLVARYAGHPHQHILLELTHVKLWENSCMVPERPLVDGLGSLIHKETRYNSTRHIDQIWSNATGTIGSARTLPFKISDHKWLSVSASLRWEREVRRCVRQRGHFWTTPPGATTSQWRDHLASTWTHYDKHVIEDSVLQALSNPNQHSVDMVWEIWNNWLQHFFGLAARTFQQPYNAETAQALNNWRRDAGTMAQRKRSNWLSRASRMVELMQKARLPFKDELEAEIKAIEAQQAQDEARCKWLGRNSQLRPTVMHNGQQLNKDQEVLDAVAAHWQDVWKACKQEPAEPKIAFVLDYLPQHEPLHGRPSSTDFLEAWQQLGGAAGPDDWLLSELQVLPPGVAELFATVTETWEVAGCTPSALKYSRQLNLVKPHKMRDGSTKSSDLRPINVYSLWYRWWSGAWAKSKIVRVWRGRVMPAAITGGIGSPGSERLAAKLQDSFSEQGFLATLDYTLAFDHVIPEAITRGMARMGLPVQLANTLLNQWSHQKRILQWKASSSPKLLETDMSVPQGDALSPLALNILMLSGFNFTEARCPVPLGDRLHVVYMDDRSWTTKQASVLVQTLRTWHDFSRRAGLRENEAKTQITHTDAERRRELQQELADDPVLLQAVTASAVVLGCCTTGTDERDAQPKELQRLADAKLICGRIRLLPLGHQAKMDAARIMGISKAVYGWVAFSPSDSHAKVLDQALRATSEAFKDGNLGALPVIGTVSFVHKLWLFFSRLDGSFNEARFGWPRHKHDLQVLEAMSLTVE
ncbi:CAC, partial [Symbiodinium sp. KB8]